MVKFLTFLFVAALAIFVVYPIIVSLIGLMISAVVLSLVLIFLAVVIAGVPGCVKASWDIVFK